MGWEQAAIQAGGAVLGGALGGKKQGGNSAPKWLRHGAKALAAQGQNLGQTPYTPYGGERVAGFSPDTMAAFDMIRNNVGASTPAYQQAMAASQGLTNFEAPQVTAAQWAGQDLSPYMNPYIQNVVDAQAADQQNAYGQAYNGLASQAQAAGAFGGSRFGVAQGQLSADSVRNQALISAQLRSQGFDTAAGLLSDDVTRQNVASGLNQNAAIQSGFLRGQAAGQLGNLAGEYQNSLGADASALGGIGSAQQALNQQQLDVNYGNYWDQTRAYPSQQMNWWSGSLQPGVGIAGTQQPATGGGLLGTLGGAQIGGQVGNSIYDWWKRPPTNNPSAMIDPATGFAYAG
jgi:hypothetical protein